MPRRSVALMAVLVALLTTLAAPASANPVGASRPSVYGGSSASGNPGVVAIAIYDGGQWTGICSAAMWKPRLLLTAAHCVTKDGTSAGIDSLAVFPPGATAVVYSDTGPQGASPIRVRQWWKADGYVNKDGAVQPNDFAVIELESDLAPPAYTRLATRAEIARWARDQSQVEHVGYGLIGPGQPTNDPHVVTLPVVAYSPNSALGETFSTAQTATQGVCPGDSGSPVFRSENGAYYLLGIEAGSNSPCQDPPSSTLVNLSFVAYDYLPILNAAAASAGYAMIPSSPQGVAVSARNSDVTVRWQPPAVSPGTVVGYDVIDSDGTVVCQTAALGCTITGLPDGSHSFAVRSRNVDNEGDAGVPAAAAVIVGGRPPRLPAPWFRRVSATRTQIVFRTLWGKSSAAVSSYVVKDQRGRVVCSGLPQRQDVKTLACALPRERGTYRFTVIADTELGDTPPSRFSRAIRVR